MSPIFIFFQDFLFRKTVFRVLRENSLVIALSFGTDESFLNFCGKDLSFSALCHFFLFFSVKRYPVLFLNFRVEKKHLVILPGLIWAFGIFSGRIKITDFSSKMGFLMFRVKEKWFLNLMPLLKLLELFACTLMFSATFIMIF